MIKLWINKLKHITSPHSLLPRWNVVNKWLVKVITTPALFWKVWVFSTSTLSSHTMQRKEAAGALKNLTNKLKKLCYVYTGSWFLQILKNLFCGLFVLSCTSLSGVSKLHKLPLFIGLINPLDSPLWSDLLSLDCNITVIWLDEQQ